MIKKCLGFLSLSTYYFIGNKINKKLGGYKIRAFLSKFFLLECGANIKIDERVFIGNGYKLRIGDNCVIGPESRIIVNNYITIGKDSQLGPRVTILTGNHNFDNLEIPFSMQGSTTKPVMIEEDVWIGANATILPGVTIGRGAIVGAGAVVTKSVESFSIVGGNPAKIIRYRGDLQKKITN